MPRLHEPDAPRRVCEYCGKELHPNYVALHQRLHCHMRNVPANKRINFSNPPQTPPGFELGYNPDFYSDNIERFNLMEDYKNMTAKNIGGKQVDAEHIYKLGCAACGHEWDANIAPKFCPQCGVKY